jgi:hypothetical protein
VERSFPLYRKYPNNKSYFKVLTELHFIELQIIGKYFRMEEFVAKIMPDRYLVSDMIDLSQGFWVSSSEEEYEAVLAHCRENLQKAG